jgi:hypothetical protein
VAQFHLGRVHDVYQPRGVKRTWETTAVADDEVGLAGAGGDAAVADDEVGLAGSASDAAVAEDNVGFAGAYFVLWWGTTMQY